MRRKLGLGCMVLGAALVLAAMGLFLQNRQEALDAENAAEQILPQLMERLEPNTEPGQPMDDQTDPTDPTETTYPDPYDPVMTEIEIEGYLYIGFLSIPRLDLELPVMSDWSYPQLKIAPCRYVGSTKTGDLVIAAHNYAKHFGGLKDMEPGELVYFTDMDGRVWRYEVEAVDILAPTAVEDMTAGEYDLTLFTCTYGGQSRVTLRCRLLED